MTICFACRRGQHDGCIEILTYENCECTHEVQEPVISVETTVEADEEETETYTRRYKEDSELQDQQSTGRKRAAALFPLKNPDGSKKPCDFVNKSNVLPNFMEVQIDGCGVREGSVPGVAQARHHHDYNTLNNGEDNVVILCHNCHNLLHAKNDPHKDKIYFKIHGYMPETSHLKVANKTHKSGVISRGTAQSPTLD